MSHALDLSSALQSALLKPVVGPITVKCIVDPDGVNLDLSSYIDLSGQIVISKSKSIRPYGQTGRFTIGEVSIRMVDRDDYFNPENIESPFYHYTTRLYAAKGSADTSLKVLKGAAANLAAGKVLTVTQISDNTVAEFTVDSLDDSNADYDLVNLTASGSVALAAGSWVETRYLPGKRVVLRNTIADEAEEITQFWGILKGLPRLTEEGAEIVLQDLFRLLLEARLNANSYLTMLGSNNSTQSTVEYSRVDASDGELDLSSATIDSSKCPIGTWEIEFLDGAGAYRITDPTGVETESDTSYLNTMDALTLPAGGWSGSFDEGDRVTFQTVLSLGNGVNSYNTIPKMLKALLTEAFGAGLDAGDLDSSFDSLIADYDEMRGAITFSRPTTVLKAIETLQSHVNASVYQTNGGTFAVAAYRPQLTPATVHPLSPAADVREVKAEYYDPIDRVTGKYNHLEGSYGNEVNWPPVVGATNQALDVNLPAYKASDRGQAIHTVSRISNVWRRGLRTFDINEKFNYGIALDVNDVAQVSSVRPSLNGTNVELFEIKKDILNLTVQALGYDIDFAFGQYAFTDNHYTDTGYACW